MTERNREHDHAETRPAKPSGEAAAGNPPVSPVENYDLGKVDKRRRIFGNGDTDREDIKP